MLEISKTLKTKLKKRKDENALRTLHTSRHLTDFSSNDYLGFSKSHIIFKDTYHYLATHNIHENGASGSRLLTGNYPLYKTVEDLLCQHHHSESALIFNSGYNANLGFFSCVPQRNDVILFDEYIHASIRDGIKLSNAKAYKFVHNNLNDLRKVIQLNAKQNHELYIVTESVFSMDGDSPNFAKLMALCQNYKARLVVDEAHATGVFGKKGMGFTFGNSLEHSVFARIITFGKALGCHGAAILGSKMLRDYLINFSRPLMYTTALPPHTLATIFCAYKQLPLTKAIEELHQNILFFKTELDRLQLQNRFIDSTSAIQCCMISGNDAAKNIAIQLQEKGFDVKPILSPTVTKGDERLRFCVHSYNSKQEITKVLNLLATFVMA